MGVLNDLEEFVGVVRVSVQQMTREGLKEMTFTAKIVKGGVEVCAPDTATLVGCLELRVNYTPYEEIQVILERVSKEGDEVLWYATADAGEDECKYDRLDTAVMRLLRSHAGFVLGATKGVTLSPLADGWTMR